MSQCNVVTAQLRMTSYKRRQSDKCSWPFCAGYVRHSHEWWFATRISDMRIFIVRQFRECSVCSVHVYLYTNSGANPQSEIWGSPVFPIFSSVSSRRPLFLHIFSFFYLKSFGSPGRQKRQTFLLTQIRPFNELNSWRIFILFYRRTTK